MGKERVGIGKEKGDTLYVFVTLKEVLVAGDEDGPICNLPQGKFRATSPV